MKRGPQHSEDAESGPRQHKQQQQQQMDACPFPMCMKLLLSAQEASSVIGPGGGACREIGRRAGVRLHLSGRGEHYPGTCLQELRVTGPSADAVAAGLTQALARIAYGTGRISCGEDGVDRGGAHAKFVVPVSAARAIIGRGGENVRALRTISGLFVHIEEVAIGAGDAAEQVVSLQGNLEGIAVALPVLIDKVADFAPEPGFAVWAATSHAGHGCTLAAQLVPGMANGKDKGGPWQSRAAASAVTVGILNDNRKRPDEASGRLHEAPRTELEWCSEAESASVELLASAIATLPPGVLDPSDRSQKVTFSCPASCVGAIIGKGGAGVKEVSSTTQTKIMIREIEDNVLEKAVIIMGSAVGVAAAYLYLSGRIAVTQMSTPTSGLEAPVGILALPG